MSRQYSNATWDGASRPSATSTQRAIGESSNPHRRQPLLARLLAGVLRKAEEPLALLFVTPSYSRSSRTGNGEEVLHARINRSGTL